MYRVSMFFRAATYSWSESHLLVNTTVRLDAEAAGFEIAKKRAALMGENCHIIGVRVGDANSKRAARLIEIGGPTIDPPNYTNPKEGETTSDDPNMAVLVRASGPDPSSGRLHQTRFFLSGVPDSLITVRASVPEFKATPQWTSRMNQYAAQLISAGAGFLATRNRNGGVVKALVVSNVPPGEIGIRIVAPLVDIQVGQYANLFGFKTVTGYTKNLKGRYQVSSVVAPTAPDTLYTVYLRGTGGIDPSTFAQLGSYNDTEKVGILYTEVNAVGATSRDRGGSYGLPRGRSRVTKR